MRDDREDELQEHDDVGSAASNTGEIDPYELAERVYKLMLRELRLEHARVGDAVTRKGY